MLEVIILSSYAFFLLKISPLNLMKVLIRRQRTTVVAEASN